MRQFTQQILPAGLPGDDGLGLRRGARRASERGLLVHNAPSLTIEAQVRADRSGSSGSTSSSTRTATTCRTCCRSTRRCTGRTRPAASTGRDMRPTFDSDARALHRPGPDRHARARRRRASATRATATPRPGTCRTPNNIPAGYADRGHLVRLLRRQGGRQVTASPGDPASPPSSTRTTTAPRRSGTTTTRWA